MRDLAVLVALQLTLPTLANYQLPPGARMCMLDEGTVGNIWRNPVSLCMPDFVATRRAPPNQTPEPSFVRALPGLATGIHDTRLIRRPGDQPVGNT